MKILFMAIGGFLIAFGLVDLLGSFAQFDLWDTIGVQLPDIIWKFSAYIELAIGFGAFKLGKSISENASAEESTSTP